MKSAVFRLSVGITCVSVFGLVSFGSTWNVTQARGTRCNEGMSCHLLWSRQISWSATRLLASRNDFLSLAPRLLSCLIPIHPFHVWRYSPFWALDSLKRRLRSSLSSPRLLHFCILGPVMHLENVLPCRSWFSYWFVLWNFPLRTSFEILLLFSWRDVPPMFVAFP